ncbi:alkyl/aryl-sulfatase [Planktotalea sp.]|uniref:alkyl/aryl-sulfatase n=1 Tax=Planktotalea sp. TaxID=2029877 RepID=UPI003F6D5AF7
MISVHTNKANAAIANRLPLARADAERDASRGWLASLKGPVMRADGGVAWDPAWFDFLATDCPDTANPSLWRHAQLNAKHGLFEVTDGVWQARGCDYANMTIIRGDSGWILVDPLMTSESSAAALALVNDTLGQRPVSAVLVTHTHPDHFAGLRGVTSDNPPIYAPEHFMDYAAAEGVLGGNHTSRRAVDQFGIALPIGPEGMIDGGIGKTVARGNRGFVVPTDYIKATGEKRIIDGVAFEFLMASGTEAPAEFTFLMPDHGVLCMAEVCTQTMHNVLTPRGAEVRDPLLWARVIDDALCRFRDRTDILINSHNWPIWGREGVEQFMLEQRDIYKFTHDQTLRLANHGMGPDEIAAALREPDFLSEALHARGYYGTLAFNARATYQKYYGFFDGRPISLNPLPPEQLGVHYVEALGGVGRVLELSEKAVSEGNLQWAATLLNHAVFAHEDSAKAPLAEVYRNMAYGEESAIMRNIYLAGAQELEQGAPRLQGAGGRNSDLAATLGLKDWFDAMAVRLNPEKARDVSFAIRFIVDGEAAVVSVARQVEFARIGDTASAVDCAVTLGAEDLEALAAGTLSAKDLDVSGDIKALTQWLNLHDTFDLWFNIATP